MASVKKGRKGKKRTPETKPVETEAPAETVESEEPAEPTAEPTAEPVAAPADEPAPEKVKPEKVKSEKKSKKKSVESGTDAFLAAAQKKWPGTIAKASTIPTMHVPRIATGNVGLDIAMYGGWPGGRISIAFGKEKSGKTGSCLNTVAEWQHYYCGQCYRRECDPECDYHGDKANRPIADALWIDAENRLEKMWYWVQGHGVALDHLIIQAPPSGQYIVDFVDAAIRDKGASIGLIIADSAAHFTSQEEIDKETIKGRTAPVNALLINKALRKWTSAVNSLGVAEKKKPTIILINQLRQTLDSFGDPEVQTGGKGLRYAHSIEVRFTGGKYHYLVPNETGGVEDKVQTFGAKWKPGPDDAPDYQEINYRVTSSGVCPMGRYGQFNYWVKNKFGRKLGDPDNADRLWEYSKRYDYVERDGRTHKLFGTEASSLEALKIAFYDDKAAQKKAWDVIVTRLIATE